MVMTRLRNWAGVFSPRRTAPKIAAMSQRAARRGEDTIALPCFEPTADA